MFDDEKLPGSLKETSSSSDWPSPSCLVQPEREVSKHTSMYVFRDTFEPHVDVNLALSEEEKKLCKRSASNQRKESEKSACSFNPVVKESLDVQVAKREECEVVKDNVCPTTRLHTSLCQRL